jgi:O-antigen/teichoic acid export membrane protein
MSISKTVAHNALWNWTGLAVQVLVGFLIAPFLVRSLGSSTYGLWIIIASLTGYFGIFDLGVRGSVGRNVALFRALGNLSGINSTLSTAFFYLCGVMVLALGITFGSMIVFFHLIDVSPDQVDAVRLALLLVGLNVALALPLQAFDGILWAYERFDLQNGVDVPIMLLRAGLTWLLIGAGHGLVALAVITLATTLAGFTAKAVLAMRVEPRLRVGWSLVHREAAGRLFGYGIWFFLLSLVRTLAPPLNLTIIGNRLGTALVTPYTVATSLTGYANQFLIAGTQVLTPVATAMHARDDHEQQRALFLKGGQACLALALLVFGLGTFLGGPFIRLWMGRDLEGSAAPLLVILLAGELLPMSQWITYSMILGKGRHKVLALSAMLEIAVAAPMALLAADSYGLTGVCLALAIPAALCRGVYPMIFACHMLEVPVWTYVGRTMLPVIAMAAGPILLLGVVTRYWLPGNWLELILLAGAFTVLYVPGALWSMTTFPIPRLWWRARPDERS